MSPFPGLDNKKFSCYTIYKGWMEKRNKKRTTAKLKGEKKV